MRRAPGRRVGIDGSQTVRELQAPAAAGGGPDRSQAALNDRLAPGERVGESAAVDVFELTADGHAVRDPAGTQSAAGGELGEKMCRGLSFDGRIDRKSVV